MNPFENGLLRYYSPEELKKIQSKKIGIAGAGGLGSNIALCLVRSGFKQFEVLDLDVIEASNLNRQQYILDDIGRQKAATLKTHLLKINPDLSFNPHQTKLTAKNTKKFFQDVDILFEAFDNIESKKLILESYGNTNKLIICGSGMAGIMNNREIKIKKINPSLYIVGDGKTSINDAPPLAPRVTTCAALMASVALEHTLTLP